MVERDAATGSEPTGPSPTAGRRQLAVLSLGGCVTHDVCKRAEGGGFRHVGHLWRRPTIPLMCRPAGRVPVLGPAFPPEMARYWEKDFRKDHRRDLRASPASVLVFDLTRDAIGSFYEVEDGCFVLDPMSVQGVLWYGDGLTEDDVKAVLPRSDRRIRCVDDGFFAVWRASFDAFAALARRFDTVVLNRFLFTTVVASQAGMAHGDADEARAVNAFLDEAHDYVAATCPFIRINAIPRRYMTTGVDVPWGGPNYTHLHHEAVALFADGLRAALFGPSRRPGGLLAETAFDRVSRHEDLMREVGDRVAERDALHASLAEAERRSVELAGERDGLAARLRAAQSERQILQVRLMDAERQRDELAAQLRAAPPPAGAAEVRRHP